jgi:hypothetical protein
MTDVGTTPRGTMSPMRRLRIFEAGRGVCILCDQRIRAGDTWTVEHRTPLGLGGADTDENCGPAHEACRRIKDKTDVAAIAKAKRAKAKHFGIRKQSSFPCGRSSPWKKRIDGSVVRR